MKILYIAEITGKAGMWLVKTQIKELKQTYSPDFVIANANSATASGGLGRQHAGYLKKLGIDCITGGDLIFQKKDLVEYLDKMTYVLRPFNLPKETPGNGFKILHGNKDEKLVVISAIGRVGFHRLMAENPYTGFDILLDHIKKITDFIIIDFASFATAEKQTLLFMLAGKVSAVVGSGTKVQTSDAGIVEKTAYITDAGRTGSLNSVGGYAVEDKIREYRTCLTEFGKTTWERPSIQGFFIELDEKGGAVKTERIFKEVELCGNPEE